ncbi:MAG: hypothetical protein MZV64_65890 [Ignavibacteriales bacterium]|nr:hypothetical protein [Ignavibacteriales bacterium]
MQYLRAVENRRAVVRCANGGVSCLINANLVLQKLRLKCLQELHLVVDVPLNNEKTFYTKNPLIIPVLSSAFSFWIFGMNILIVDEEKI